jgi:DNA-binding MarR family transcriptional regulator
LGISKQAAGKTVDALERLGYVARAADPADARKRIVRLTGRGEECLRVSGAILDDLHRHWDEVLGGERLEALEADLAKLAPEEPAARLDAPGWFSERP